MKDSRTIKDAYPMDYEEDIQASLHYLGSDKALRAIARDPYWPKWDSPWWHMLLLFEMGEVKRIPAGIVAEYVAALNRIPVKIFPIYPGEMPEGVDPYRGVPCHCQLGNAYQVLAAWGIDVDGELPWIRPWFLRYQMADGGLNCDNDAYLVKDEIPSSMVGTISAFEAILRHTPRPWTVEEKAFLDKGAQFLMGRKLIGGSETEYNAAERISAGKWLQPCFPRFYLYDALRGLVALLHWSHKTKGALPPASIREVVTCFSRKFPGGRVRNERQAYEGLLTRGQSASGEWLRGRPATFFPLLGKVSALGEISPFLSRQWEEAKGFLTNHKEFENIP